MELLTVGDSTDIYQRMGIPVGDLNQIRIMRELWERNVCYRFDLEERLEDATDIGVIRILSQKIETVRQDLIDIDGAIFRLSGFKDEKGEL